MQPLHASDVKPSSDLQHGKEARRHGTLDDPKLGVSLHFRQPDLAGRRGRTYARRARDLFGQHPTHSPPFVYSTTYVITSPPKRRGLTQPNLFYCVTYLACPAAFSLSYHVANR
jgi:hypothetical protein